MYLTSASHEITAITLTLIIDTLTHRRIVKRSINRVAGLVSELKTSTPWYSYTKIFVIELRFNFAQNFVSNRTIALTVTERNEPPPISYRTNLDMASNEPEFNSLEALLVTVHWAKIVQRYEQIFRNAELPAIDSNYGCLIQYVMPPSLDSLW